LTPGYSGYVAFQEKLEKLWSDDESVKVNGVTPEDLRDVLVYFQWMVQGSKQHVDDDNVDVKELTGIESEMQNAKVDESLDINPMDGTAEGEFSNKALARSDKTTDVHRPCLPQSKLSTRLSNHFFE
jgi:hypothetical protein